MKLFVFTFFLLLLSNAFAQIGQPAEPWEPREPKIVGPKKAAVKPGEELIFVSKRYIGLESRLFGPCGIGGRYNAVTSYTPRLKKDTIICRLEVTLEYVTNGKDNLGNYAFSLYDTLKFICDDGTVISLACISSLESNKYTDNSNNNVKYPDGTSENSTRPYFSFTTSFELTPESIRKILDKKIIATEFRSHSTPHSMRMPARSKRIKKHLNTMLRATGS